jgi:signal transduction histidine kinase
MRPRTAAFAALGVGVFVTLGVSTLPFLHFAYRSPELHVAVQALASLTALLAAYLLYGRFCESAALPDLALIVAFTLFGAKNLFFEAIPSSAGAGSHAFLTWAPLSANVLGAGAFAAAAFLPDRRVERPQRAVLYALVGTSLALALIAAVVAALRGSLPLAIDPTLSPADSNAPSLVGDRGVLVLQLLVMALFFAAAIGFVRRAERRRDELLTFIAAGATLGAFASLNYVLFPSIYTDWVYTGDALRLAQWLVILIGLVREIRAYWVRLARAAVLEERNRMARSLHDGLAQELAFIVTQARRLRSGGGSAETLDHLAAAAERALDESRSAIAAFTAPLEECVDVAVARAAEDVASRVGISVRFELQENVAAAAPVREDLVRIVREAVTNATRHGRASSVLVALDAADGVVSLHVSDDGLGFDPSAARASGFGLRAMHERARSLGGVMEIESRPGSGASVHVQVPRWPASA